MAIGLLLKLFRKG